MFRTTYKEAKNEAVANGRPEVIQWLKENDLKVVSIENIAYYSGVYGCNGHLFTATLSNGQRVRFTNGMRTSWMYCYENSDFGLPIELVEKK